MSLVHPCLQSPKISLDAPVNLKEFGQIPLDLVCLDSKKIAKCWPKNSFRFYFFSHVFRCTVVPIEDDWRIPLSCCLWKMGYLSPHFQQEGANQIMSRGVLKMGSLVFCKATLYQHVSAITLKNTACTAKRCSLEPNIDQHGAK